MVKEFNLDKLEELGFHTPKKSFDEYDQDQMMMGMQVEQEHTDDEEVAAIIAAHHLDEIPDYYTRLEEMEENAKEGVTDEMKKISENM